MINFFSLVFLSLGFASDGIFPGIHRSYQSPRALGMGGAHVAIANDYSAVFANPAGLARLTENHINMSLGAGFSTQYVTFSQELSDAGKKPEEEKTQALIDVLSKNYGKPFSLRAGLFEGIWAGPGKSLAVIPMDFTLDLSIHNQGPPALRARTYLDTTVAIGYADDVKDHRMAGRLSWGVTGKFVNRGFFSKELNVIDLAADSNVVRKEDLREGYTIDADVGLLYTPYLPSEGLLSGFKLARPSFGFVVRNVVETGFGQKLNLFGSEQTDKPEKLYRTIDLGSRWEIPSFWIFSGRAALDFQNLLHPNISTRKSLHAGFEFDWTMASWWKGQYRFGVNQGYPTFGVNALLGIFRLDLVTYGEDVGSFSSPQENRMYMVKLNVDI